MAYLNIGNGVKQLYALDTANPTNMNMSSDGDDLREAKAALTIAQDQIARMMRAFGISDTVTSAGTTSSGSGATVTSGSSTST